MMVYDQRPFLSSLVHQHQQQQQHQAQQEQEPRFYNRTSSSTSISSSSSVSGSSLFSRQSYGYNNNNHNPHHDGSPSSSSNVASAAAGGGPVLLLSMMEACDWAGSLARIASHPSEVQTMQDEEGRTVLHLACDNDAPAVVVQAILKAWPQAAVATSTESSMTPLHVICSSHHASVHVVRVLIELGSHEQFQIKDPDGDLALHTAARCGAPLEVLDALLRAYPQAAQERDFEGLTPLLRLWVRYFVTLGDDAIQHASCQADLTGELREAWEKTELLLKSLYSQDSNNSSSSCHPQNGNNEFPFVVHAAASVDCPRPIVKMAAMLYPEQLSVLDDRGRTPLSVAAQAPIFKVRDLTEVGYALEEVVHDGNGESSDEEEDEDTQAAEPSVLEILLNANQDEASSAACVPDSKHGRLPLHWAVYTKKRWNQGVDALVQIYPEALTCPDPCLGLFPFQLAAMAQEDSNSPMAKPKSADKKIDLTTIYELMRRNPSLVSKTSAVAAPSKEEEKLP